MPEPPQDPLSDFVKESRAEKGLEIALDRLAGVHVLPSGKVV